MSGHHQLVWGGGNLTSFEIGGRMKCVADEQCREGIEMVL